MKKIFFGLIFGFLFCLIANGQTVKFSSVYTNLKTQCKDKFKSVGAGQDMPFVCKGYGGYKLNVDFSAAYESYSVENAKTTIELFHHFIGRVPAKQVEWRMANGKPFAVIIRINKYKDESADAAMNPKKIAEVFIIKGLAGYKHINLAVNAKSPNAILKARKLADSNAFK